MRTTAMDKRVPRSAQLSRRLIVSRNTGPRAPRVHTWLSSCTDARCPSVTPANGHGGVTPQARRGRAAHPHLLTSYVRCHSHQASGKPLMNPARLIALSTTIAAALSLLLLVPGTSAPAATARTCSTPPSHIEMHDPEPSRPHTTRQPGSIQRPTPTSAHRGDTPTSGPQSADAGSTLPGSTTTA